MKTAPGIWPCRMRPFPVRIGFPKLDEVYWAPGIGRWFDRGLARLTKGKRNSPIVIFCLADCWMSWNAALRLHRAGYTNVGWFADGIDGWKERGRSIVQVAPEP